jgi:hypothetical protein
MRDRVNIGGEGGLLFLVQARKEAARLVFAEWPQQSDYSAQWTHAESRGGPPPPAPPLVSNRVMRRAAGAARLLRRIYARGKWRRRSLLNPALKAHEWLV